MATASTSTKRDRIVMGLSICALILFVANLITFAKERFFDHSDAPLAYVVETDAAGSDGQAFAYTLSSDCDTQHYQVRVQRDSSAPHVIELQGRAREHAMRGRAHAKRRAYTLQREARHDVAREVEREVQREVRRNVQFATQLRHELDSDLRAEINSDVREELEAAMADVRKELEALDIESLGLADLDELHELKELHELDLEGLHGLEALEILEDMDFDFDFDFDFDTDVDVDVDGSVVVEMRDGTCESVDVRAEAPRVHVVIRTEDA